MKRRSKALKTVGLALASLGLVVSTGAMAAMQITTKGGLKVCDPSNPNYWFGISGRVEFDEVVYSGTFRDRQDNFPSSGNIRRALLSLNGGVGDFLTYNLAVNFGRSQALFNQSDVVTNFGTVFGPPASNVLLLETVNHQNAIHGIALIQEAWLGYTGLWDCTRIRIGQFTPIATMDGYGNDGTGNGQMFLESALATTAFTVPSYLDTDSRMKKGMGIIVDTQLYDVATLTATIYQPAHGAPNVYGVPQRSDRLGGALRLTYAPIHDCDRVLHFGAMGRYQRLNHTHVDGAPVRNTLFFTTPEVISRNYVGNPRIASLVTQNDPALLNAGSLRAKSYSHYAGEALGIYGPLTVQGEYHHVVVDRTPTTFPIALLSRANGEAFELGGPDEQGKVKFHGWHAQAGYVLTGESRGYDFASGTLEGIKPCGPCGAWEVVTRYSYLTLKNKNVYGGVGHNVTVGVNWYANDNIRLAFNYIRSNITPTGTIAGLRPVNAPAKRHLDIFAGRIQLVF